MANFEDRLLAISGPAELKRAKELLKRRAAHGVWRGSDRRLHGVFREPGLPAVECSVVTGETTVSECSACSPERVCAHALALLMYCGRFHTDESPEPPPSYAKGLRQDDLPTLAGRGMDCSAKLRLTVAEDNLHAPSKYENLLLNARLVTPDREYAGNLNNLRQLYFDKSLSVVLKFDDFPLPDQQIIRFLALNGEAVNSNILLSAELTAELFHALPGFSRFFRRGRQIVVRPERAHPVLVRVRNKVLPGLLVNGAALPISGANIITGRAGYWVGRDDEYFFIGGECESGFLRSFFRVGVQPRDLVSRFPLPIVSAGKIEPETLPLTILPDADISDDGRFTLTTEYLYRLSGGSALLPPRSGKTVIDGRNCARRDAAAEREWENRLAMFGFTMDDGSAAAVTDDTELAGLFLHRVLPDMLSGGYPRLALGGRLAAMLDGCAGLPEVTLRFELADRAADGFTLRFALTGRGTPVPWDDCLRRASEKLDFVRAGKRIFAIPTAVARLMRTAGTMFKTVDPVAGTVELPRCNLAYFRELAGEIPGAVPPQLADSGELPAPPPAGQTFAFEGELRSYQREGVAFMQHLADRNFNALLADEMGLGKTVQLLALLASRMVRGGRPSLIVCPASLTVNWEREAHRFVPGFRVAAPRGAERNAVLKDPGNFDLLILSYTAARMSRELLRKCQFEFLVLDEAQHIKNPGSENARNCKSFAAAHKIVLSGTPLENSHGDLWSVMDFLQPGMLGTLPAFRRRYAGIADDPELQHDLTCRTAPFIKRRTKSEVAADLPEKSERTLYCDPEPDQLKLYRKILASGGETIASGTSAEIFSLLLRLRQICCHPALLPDRAGAGVGSGKTDLLFELLDETLDSGHKVLLFSQFTSMLQLLVPMLEKRGIPFEYLDGTTRDRQDRVDRFNRDPEIPLFLLSLKAGGTGLNLTAADTVILYDPWWNPAVELQAADRTHRIGQTRPVSTIKLVMRNSVEEKVLALQERKRRLFDALVGSPASSGLALDELRALFETEDR